MLLYVVMTNSSSSNNNHTTNNNNNNNSNNHDTVVNLPIDSIREDQRYSTLLPSIGSNDYEALKNDIMKNGIKLPLIINSSNILLDGYTRLRIAKELGLKEIPCIVKHSSNELEEKLFVLTINIHRRHLDVADRVKLGLEIKKLKEELYKGKEKRLLNLLQFQDKAKQTPISTTVLIGYDNNSDYSNDSNNNNNNDNRQRQKTRIDIWSEIAREVGISKSTLAKGNEIAEKAEKDQEIAKQLQEFFEKKRSLESVYRRLKEKEARANLKPIIEEGKARVEDLAKITILHGDFRDVLKDIPDNSIDLIFTDPPYDRASVPLLRDLAVLASRLLKPSGFIAVMYEHVILLELIDALRTAQDMEYYCTISMYMQDSREVFFKRNIEIGWKPIVVFQKRPMVAVENRFKDNIISDYKPDKSIHEWKQDLKSTMHVIRSLSKEGDTILDPMVGTGTTVEACLLLNRRCIAVEKDKELYEMLLRRYKSD